MDLVMGHVVLVNNGSTSLIDEKIVVILDERIHTPGVLVLPPDCITPKDVFCSSDANFLTKLHQSSD